MEKLKQIQGSIFGLAIGDALGYPCEFRTRQQIVETFSPKGVETFAGCPDWHFIFA